MTDLNSPSLRSALGAHWTSMLVLAVLVFSSWISIYYSGQPIVERETFRQTETALTAYWMIKDGWRLAYETPGWGYPWAVPIEFPIHQTFVALIAGTTHFPLEPVGRLISFAFLIACAWPAHQIGQRLKLPREAAWVFCALLWSSPLYLYWGRTFMIETAAVFFTLAAIPYVLDLREPQPSWRSAIAGSWWATLGMLQKSITTGPVLLVLGLVLLAPSLRTWPPAMTLRRFACQSLALGLPLAIGVLWTIYADLVKEQNFVGRELTSKFRLSKQVLGTISQRLDLSALMDIFWHRIFEQNAAGFLGVALVLGALCSSQEDVRRIIAVCLTLSMLPIVFFFNASLLLEYYQVSSVVFLIAALAFCCVVWLPTVTHWRGAVPLVSTVLVISNLSHFWFEDGQAVWANMAQNRALVIGDVIRRYTPDDTGIIVFGLNEGLSSISPEVPYFSQRKGFTVPDWAENRMENDPASYLGGKALGAIVFCSTINKDLYNRLIERYSETSSPRLFRVSGCYVWLPHTPAVVLADGTSVLPTEFLK